MGCEFQDREKRDLCSVYQCWKARVSSRTLQARDRLSFTDGWKSVLMAKIQLPPPKLVAVETVGPNSSRPNGTVKTEFDQVFRHQYSDN